MILIVHQRPRAPAICSSAIYGQRRGGDDLTRFGRYAGDGGIRGGWYFALCQGPPPRRGAKVFLDGCYPVIGALRQELVTAARILVHAIYKRPQSKFMQTSSCCLLK